MAELVGGALLSASLQVLFDRLTSAEVSNFFQANGLNKKLLDRLKTTLDDANAVLDAAEYKQFSNPSVRQWLGDLRDAVYHAEDLVDEISTKAATEKQVRNIFTRLFHDREMGNKMAEITNKLESIMKRKDNLGLEKKDRENLSRSAQSSWRPPTTSLVEESDVYGRSEAKDSVIKILLDDKDDDSTLAVIPIVGMGGIGKTTLAQLVYNDDKVEDKFNLKAWVCVSEDFDVPKITKTILKAVSSASCDREDLDSIQLELKKRLSGEKFLVVLDDIWNKCSSKWDLLLKPFLHGAEGSKILLTTRNDDVASVVRTNPAHTYHVGTLSDEDSWFLFAKHAFHFPDSAMSSGLEKIGRDIVKKCKGLPLTIKALGGLLRSKNDINDWNIILKSDLWDLPEECEILPALGISYLSLSPHLKQCFAYCSLFPKDYLFDKENLIQLWMAQGFLQSSNKKISMEEVGHVSFDALVARLFFQHSTTFSGRFIMHDLMHDLSIFCAGEFCHRLGTGDAIEIPKRTRHLSYHGNEVTSQDIEALCAMREEALRSIINIGRSTPQAKHLDRLLSKFKLLRALSLGGFQDEVLPDSIGQLMFLRYLDLSYSSFEMLPAALCNLPNLQTLKLLHGSMQPKGINKLKKLRFLSLFRVSKDEGANIGELGGLSNICKLPLVWDLENVRSSKEAFEARMMDKKFMEELGLFWFSNDVNDSETERDILDKLQPHSNLKVLRIHGYRGTRFPDWLGYPSYHIVDIELSSCNDCCLLPPLGQLPFLKNLKLKHFDKLVNVDAEFYKSSSSPLTTPFPSLENLFIHRMPVLQEWSSTEIEAFPKPQFVQFSECPELVKCCISAKHIEFVGCEKLEFPKQQRYHSLESLSISDCQSLPSFPGDTFPNLKKLNICFCRNLKKSAVERLAAVVTKINIHYCEISPEEVQHLNNVEVHEDM